MNDLVFPSGVFTPIGGDRITHEFPILARMAGLPVIRLHDCRHTAAAIMLSHGPPSIIVAEVTCRVLRRVICRRSTAG